MVEGPNKRGLGMPRLSPSVSDGYKQDITISAFAVTLFGPM